MAKQFTELKRLSLWLFALLVIAAYVPDLQTINYSSDVENAFCSLEKKSKTAPPRAWAIEINQRPQWVAAI